MKAIQFIFITLAFLLPKFSTAQCIIDAAVRFDNTRAYFFQGKEYYRYNLNTRKIDQGYPKHIADHWGGVWSDGLDAALNYDAETIYLFKGNQCIRYSKETHKALPGYPKLIRKEWVGLWQSDIDAALDMGEEAYFFKGPHVLKFNKANRTFVMVENKLKLNIGDLLDIQPFQKLDAALDLHTENFYLYKGKQYTRLKKSALKNGSIAQQDKGYPKLNSNWTGLNCTETPSEETTRFRVKISYLKCESVDDANTPAELIANKIGVYESSEEIYGAYKVRAKNFRTGEVLPGDRDELLWHKIEFDPISLKAGDSYRIDEEIYFDFPNEKLDEINIHLMAFILERDGELTILKMSTISSDKMYEIRTIPAKSISRTTKKYTIDHNDGGTLLRTVFYVQRMN